MFVILPFVIPSTTLSFAEDINNEVAFAIEDFTVVTNGSPVGAMSVSECISCILCRASSVPRIPLKNTSLF